MCPSLSSDDIRTKLVSLQSPGILPPDSLEAAFKKTLIFQLAQMLHHQPAALEGSDIEGVHKMRVAVRRMRTAFEYIRPYFKRKAFKPCRSYAKNAGRVLGGCRDLDVIILVLQKYGLWESPAVQAVYKSDLSDKRQPVVESIQADEHSRFIEQFYNFLTIEPWGVRAKMAAEGALNSVDYLPKLVQEQWVGIAVNYADLEPEPYQRLHNLRIDLKRLRYLLEFFREITQPEVTNQCILDIIQLQDHLGELNDLHSTIQLIMDYQGRSSAVQIETDDAVPQLLLMRRQAAEAFMDVWGDFKGSGISEQLTQII